MDIYDYLKKDHEKVNSLFKQFKQSPKKRKNDIAQFIADELIVHAQSEQEIFYSTLEKQPESKDIAIHGWKEHKEIKDKIKEFDNQILTETKLINHIEALEELVKHHVKEEEGKLFRKAKKVLSEEQSYALKELMHDLKHQLLRTRRRRPQKASKGKGSQ